ncbi:MAG: hypothetical protein LBQ19_06455 [Synergistaceae bacterium]|jgi:hypothetical protein|nr:hypothetical protein [Synergistaceae bacterium]
MEELKVLCDSAASKPTPKWMSAAAVTLGMALLYNAYAAFSEGGFHSKFVYNAILGAVCAFGAGISRRLYLSDAGIVRETRSWGRVIRRILPWNDIRHVTLAYRGDRITAFFETGPTGWKAPFLRVQEDEILDIFEDMMPDVEVETLTVPRS